MKAGLKEELAKTLYTEQEVWNDEKNNDSLPQA
jgi:hypothetical protein